MELILPIRGVKSLVPAQISDQPVYISQGFGNKWIAHRDMVVGGVELQQGDDVYKKVFNMDGHNGIDIVAPRGYEIIAPHDGFVIEAGTGSGYGYRVSVYWEADGNEYISVFGHLLNWDPLEEMRWKYYDRSQPVKKGDRIGAVNSTGFSTGDHLHWGLAIYKNGRKQNTNNGFKGAIDPLQFVREESDQLRLVRISDGTIAIETGNIDKRYIGFADLNALGIMGDEPQKHIDGPLEPMYNIIKTNKLGKIVVVNK